MILDPEVLSVAKGSCETCHFDFHSSMPIFLRPWFMAHHPTRTRETSLKERPSKILNMGSSPRNAMHDSSHKFTVGSTLVNVGKKKKSAIGVLKQEKRSKFCTHLEMYPDSVPYMIDSGVAGTNPVPLVRRTSRTGGKR